MQYARDKRAECKQCKRLAAAVMCMDSVNINQRRCWCLPCIFMKLSYALFVSSFAAMQLDACLNHSDF